VQIGLEGTEEEREEEKSERWSEEMGGVKRESGVKREGWSEQRERQETLAQTVHQRWQMHITLLALLLTSTSSTAIATALTPCTAC
jgi:hypothetical protein